MSDQRATARRPAGHLVIAHADGSVVEADTLQCCHCGRHWMVVRGSGRVRGFCTRCMRPTCGDPACDACVPVEQRLDRMERGLSFRDGSQ